MQEIIVKKVPKWVLDKEKLNTTVRESVEIIGQMGAAGVIDGKLPNGEAYLWFKRKNTKDTKYKGRRK